MAADPPLATTPFTLVAPKETDVPYQFRKPDRTIIVDKDGNILDPTKVTVTGVTEMMSLLAKILVELRAQNAMTAEANNITSVDDYRQAFADQE